MAADLKALLNVLVDGLFLFGFHAGFAVGGAIGFAATLWWPF